jgi:hypothetical protein
MPDYRPEDSTAFDVAQPLLMGEFSDSWLLPQDSQDDPLFSLDLDPWDPILAFGEYHVPVPGMEGVLTAERKRSKCDSHIRRCMGSHRDGGGPG